jgi:hypothetical protein
VIFVVAVLLANSALVLSAAPMGTSSEARDYLRTVEDLDPVICGLYGTYRERDVDGGQRMKSRRLMAYVGYHLKPWLMTYVTGGKSRTKFGEHSDYAGSEFEFGLGARLNLLDHDIMEPALFEDTVRIHAVCEHIMGSSDSDRRDVDWSELSAALTFSIVNEVDGNKFFLPETVTLFAGPLYSSLHRDLEEDDDLGIVGGMEVFLNTRVSVDATVEHLGEPSFSAAVNLRF